MMIITLETIQTLIATAIAMGTGALLVTELMLAYDWLRPRMDRPPPPLLCGRCGYPRVFDEERDEDTPVRRAARRRREREENVYVNDDAPAARCPRTPEPNVTHTDANESINIAQNTVDASPTFTIALRITLDGDGQTTAM
jgi:hypothetical protein